MTSPSRYSVDTTIGRLNVSLGGADAGPVALLWPSLFMGGASSWEPQLAGLHASGWRTLLVDPPGTGGSGPATPGFTLEDCAQAALMVLDTAGAQQAVFLGVSWGGFVALRVALAAPERVLALVLSNTSARRMPLKDRLRDRFLAFMVRRKLIGSVGEKAVPQLIGARARSADPAFAAALVREIDAIYPSDLATAMRSILADRTDIVGQIGAISLPVLILTGGRDPALPHEHQVEIASLIAGSRHEVIPDVGHIAPREAPQIVAVLIRQFLEPMISTA